MPAKSVNEGLARGIVSAFCAQLDPTLEELCDIKTAVSEAVTNCIVHAYKDMDDDRNKKILLKAEYYDDGLLCVTIKDNGCGIDDIEKAMQPMYSGSGSDERSGMGFSIMQCFTDKMKVKSNAEIMEFCQNIATPLGITVVDVEFKQGKNPALTIFIDKDGGVDLDTCELFHKQA